MRRNQKRTSVVTRATKETLVFYVRAFSTLVFRARFLLFVNAIPKSDLSRHGPHRFESSVSLSPFLVDFLSLYSSWKSLFQGLGSPWFVCFIIQTHMRTKLARAILHRYKKFMGTRVIIRCNDGCIIKIRIALYVNNNVSKSVNITMKICFAIVQIIKFTVSYLLFFFLEKIR